MYKLFDIQRGSLVDGRGVRTTVFFRGCNLRCAWCHNPESQSGEKSIFHYAEKCTRCGKCTLSCAENAIVFGKTDYKKCSFCGKCELVCPNEALKLCGRDYSEEELFSVIEKDKAFYESSGGGVTFSGGECMLYLDELKTILKLCKENGIHTAVDTAGNVSWESFDKILPYTDLFLYDIKTMDTEIHKKYIGTGNERILANLKKLFESHANVWIRVPVIGGVNDTIEEMTAIRDFLGIYSPQKIELLPFHHLGDNKYAALSIDKPNFSTPGEEEMKAFNHVFGNN